MVDGFPLDDLIGNYGQRSDNEDNYRGKKQNKLIDQPARHYVDQASESSSHAFDHGTHPSA
ncbi:hypothetical protein D3C76_1636080 [compost metagenome]